MAVFLSLLVFAASALSNPLSTQPDAVSRPYPFTLAPLWTPTVPKENLIKDRYLVVMKKEIDQSSFIQHVGTLHAQFVTGENVDSLLLQDGGLRHVYDIEGFRGYAGTFEEETIDALRTQPEVDFIEKSQMFHTMDADVQKNAPWGLARVSHRDKLTLSTFRQYKFDDDGGEGVNVYVIDTGIQVHHEEFEGRASWGATMNKQNPDIDDNGHGTHCAGTIASKAYGVAKKANVIAVKVLSGGGSGSTEDVVAGIVFAVNDAASRKKDALVKGKKFKGSVANMSLGGGKSSGLDNAVNAAVKAGVHFAVAAGNENRDACTSSPAAAELPVTVGASTQGDERAYFSNFGPCVDIFAPGLNIKSTWNGPRNDSTNIISGTSMASPHTAGLMAYLLSLYGSDSFNPPVGGKSTTSTTDAFTSLVSFARSTFPGWMTVFLPSHSTLAPIPIPDPSLLTPAIMKKALIRLSTAGALSDLPAQTVNYLAYNNASALDFGLKALFAE